MPPKGNIHKGNILLGTGPVECFLDDNTSWQFTHSPIQTKCYWKQNRSLLAHHGWPVGISTCLGGRNWKNGRQIMSKVSSAQMQGCGLVCHMFVLQQSPTVASGCIFLALSICHSDVHYGNSMGGISLLLPSHIQCETQTLLLDHFYCWDKQ